MITLTILAGIVVMIIGGWLIVERTRFGRLAWFAIPILLAWPLATYVYGSSTLGYPTVDAPPDGFALVSVIDDPAHRSLYILVRLPGDVTPRLYSIEATEANRKAFAGAQSQIAKGVPVAVKRKLRNGLIDDGDYVFYQLPPSGLPSKD